MKPSHTNIYRHAFRISKEQSFESQQAKKMSSRDYTIKHNPILQDAWRSYMEYPFSYINCEYQEGYSLEDIRRDIVVEPAEERAEAGDFPNNIQELFWARIGERDERPWWCCGQLTNGAYFFYIGSCDYTGFDCQGGMSLWISKSWNNIVDHAMEQEQYETYMCLNLPEVTDVHEEEEEEKPDEFVYCCECGYDEGTMANDFTEAEGRLCPDCYWDFDAAEKKKRRADPEWRYNRAFSSAKVLFGMDDVQAHKVAEASVANM